MKFEDEVMKWGSDLRCWERFFLAVVCWGTSDNHWGFIAQENKIITTNANWRRSRWDVNRQSTTPFSMNVLETTSKYVKYPCPWPMEGLIERAILTNNTLLSHFYTLADALSCSLSPFGFEHNHHCALHRYFCHGHISKGEIFCWRIPQPRTQWISLHNNILCSNSRWFNVSAFFCCILNPWYFFLNQCTTWSIQVFEFDIFLAEIH